MDSYRDCYRDPDGLYSYSICEFRILLGVIYIRRG